MHENTKRGLSIIEASERIGCGRSLIYELIRAGKLPARKIGARTILLAEDIEDFIAALPTVKPQRESPGASDIVEVRS